MSWLQFVILIAVLWVFNWDVNGRIRDAIKELEEVNDRLENIEVNQK
jgi:hypothetical protein